MGGRLDATTAVPADVCVITSLGLDHTQWLGNTLDRIAQEKAGIFVRGKPAIAAPQEPAARRVLEEQANQVRCPLHFVDQPLRGYPLGLAGPHQPWNAALALEALHAAGCHLTFDTVRHGLATVSWPGRFEVFPPPALPGSEVAITLDGAHNAAAAAALVATWREHHGSQRCSLVFSALAGKDATAMLAVLAPVVARIHFCPIASQRAMATADLVGSLPPDAPPHAVFPGPEAALDAALVHPDPVLVAGSLFLVGEVRARLIGATHQPSVQ
jgi:dihydrofolate synthase/folylpolyglutamate synthase